MDRTCLVLELRKLCELAPGLIYAPGYLDRDQQEALLAAIVDIIAAAPLFRPRMPRTGKAFSVEMTNCGALGWVSDQDGGYRYQAVHPETGRAWPPIPDLAQKAWMDLAGYPALPDACLVNFYDASAHMGLHQDRDEEDFAAPVLSLSLGDSCIFRFGGTQRRGKTQTIKLTSGDALVLGGAARLAFHGVDRILPGSSSLLPQGGRINLTLRQAAGGLTP
jgi:alkylated DNA repair protein (DNA oxidative demethylase)